MGCNQLHLSRIISSHPKQSVGVSKSVGPRGRKRRSPLPQLHRGRRVSPWTLARKKQTVEELKAENRALRAARNSSVFGNIVSEAIRWGSIVLIFYFVRLAVRDLAGQNTAADIGVRFFTSITVSEGLAYVLAAGMFGWGMLERRLRRKTVARLHQHTHQVEKALDPRRTSSRLTSTGETPSEDRS